MGQWVCGGAVINCSFGAAPSALMVLPDKKIVGMAMPYANIMDYKPFVNILPFAMCNSIANPAVAAATAAALGALTPMPCIPVTTSPWTPCSAAVLAGGQPAFNNTAKCMCSWGGVISVNFAGQVTVEVP